MSRFLSKRLIKTIISASKLNFKNGYHISTALYKEVPMVNNAGSSFIDDPNIFGTLTKRKFLNNNDPEQNESNKQFLKEPESDDENVIVRAPRSQQLSTKEYADLIKDYINKHQIKEAIDVLEVRMLKQDKVKPENYIYSLLIGACGRVGYTKKAFKLFNDMKKRGLKVHPGMYTGLFNACANSPWKEDGLSRATKLRELIAEKQHTLNETNYHAMIKAYGRHGDIKTAFSIVQEMITKKIKITTETINFLLQACISNPDEGFRYALVVWRKMIDNKLIPNLYTFNLMLRSTRDCGVGSSEETKVLIEDIIKKCELISESDVKLLEDSSQSQVIIKENRPNLLAKIPQLGNVVEIKEILNPEDKLLLIGGVQGVLEEMAKYKVTPDIKSFTQLMDCLPHTNAGEKQLMSLMKKYKLRPDIDFFNMLIKKRSQRFDHEAAKEVLEYIDKAGLQPNLITYGVLAIGCRNREEAEQLITLMEAQGYRLNSEILGAMLQQACYHNNFGYVMEIMELCLKEQIQPNKQFMERLLKFRQKCLKIVADKNSQENLSKDSYFVSGYKLFNMRYQTWKTQIKADETVDTHPWQQYRETTQTDATNYKDPNTYFKPRRSSKFGIKTSTKIRY